MRNILLCIIFLSGVFTLSFATKPAKNQIVNVFAPSGLKLRAQPNLHAEVIDIVRYGDRVKVLDTFEYSEEKATRIDWIDGHWILVEFDGLAGYIFDGYLSTLPFPDDLDQMVCNGYTYAYTLGEYFETHFEVKHLLDSTEVSFKYILENGCKIKQSIKDGLWHLEIEIPDHSIHEILNVMRGMIPDRQYRIAFDNSLIFIEGISGSVEEIKINLGEQVTLKKKQNGNILVKASGYTGC